MNKYEIRTQKKKNAIICASLQLFKKKGFINTSINEIAKESGVSSVSIYNYFGSKEELVRECAKELLMDTTQMITDLLAEDINFEQKLEKAVSMCVQKPHELMDEYFSKDALDDKVFVNLLSEGVKDIRLDLLSEFIDSGKKEGAIDNSISTDTIMAFLNAITAVQASWETRNEHREKSVELFRLMMFGLIGQR